MQRSLIAVALSLTLCTAVHAQEPAAVAAQRDTNQQERIEQGLQSGQLSSKEAGQLERDEQHLDRTQARDLKSGGALTPQEKAQITRQQNAASRDIYQDKHNGVTGNPNSASSQRLQADVQRNANQQQRIATHQLRPADEQRGGASGRRAGAHQPQRSQRRGQRSCRRQRAGAHPESRESPEQENLRQEAQPRRSAAVETRTLRNWLEPLSRRERGWGEGRDVHAVIHAPAAPPTRAASTFASSL